jgi:hypothetical protein
MCPDIEWHVGEDAEQETIARVTTHQPSRWRKPIVAVVMALGLGLGVIYASIPEPSPNPVAPTPTLARPVPTPTITPPTPLPPVIRSALESAILREARALADGDAPGYIAMQDSDLYQRRQDALGLYSVWGRPDGTDPYYTIRQTGTVNADTAWADVVQYRDGQFFRDLRFFRFKSDRWVRTRTTRDISFWGAEQTLSLNHFNVVYRARDVEAVRAAITYLGQRYFQICRTFGCPDQPSLHTLNIVFQPGVLDAAASSDPASRYLTVTLPTPGAMGLYYSTLEATTLGRNNRLDEFFDRYFLLPTLLEAAGGADRWLTSNDGVMYVYAIGLWELKRQGRLPAGEFPYRPDLWADEDLSLTQADMWTMTQADDLSWARSSALIQFVDETYGAEAVIKFFRALQHAQSLPHAIEITGLPYSDVEAKWTDWLKQQRGG